MKLRRSDDSRLFKTFEEWLKYCYGITEEEVPEEDYEWMYLDYEAHVTRAMKQIDNLCYN